MSRKNSGANKLLVATAALGIGLNTVVAVELYALKKDISCDPTTHKIFPQECLTNDFFETLNSYFSPRYVTFANYEAAVDSFLNPQERAYATTLGSSGEAEEEILRAFNLQSFLGGVELCGTPETPSCEELIIDPSCGCPRWDYSKSKDVVDRIYDVRVQEGTYPRQGKIEVRFDETMRYVLIEGNQAIVKELAPQEPFKTRFRPHWDYNLVYKLEK